VLSAGAALIARGTKVNFGGYASIRIPGRVFDPNNAGAWVGEGQPIPARNLAVSGAVLSPRKLAVIATFTREVAESSNVEAVARASISESAAVALDAAMLSTDADDGVKPAGLLHDVTPITATTGGGAAALAGDIGNLLAALAANGAGLAPVFVAAPQQAGALKVWAGPKFDYPVLASAALPAATVIAIEASALASAFSPVPEFSSCIQGVLHEDTVPLDIVDSSGTPAPNTRSLWQTDVIALRMVVRASYGMRGIGLVQVIQNVTW
jgi:Phage capsid family